MYQDKGNQISCFRGSAALAGHLRGHKEFLSPPTTLSSPTNSSTQLVSPILMLLCFPLKSPPKGIPGAKEPSVRDLRGPIRLKKRNSYFFTPPPKRQLTIHTSLTPDMYMGEGNENKGSGIKMQEGGSKRTKEGKEKATRKELNIFNSDQTRNACLSTRPKLANVTTRRLQPPPSAGGDDVGMSLKPSSASPCNTTPSMRVPGRIAP